VTRKSDFYGRNRFESGQQYGENNPSCRINNTNVTRRVDLFKNKSYVINSDYVSNKNDDYNNLFSIFHQNIRGIM
jgi:hypothetical protein